MDPVTALISLSVVSLVMIVGSFIVIIPAIKEQVEATGQSGTKKTKPIINCPNNATVHETKYSIPNYPGCFCNVGSILNPLTNHCDLCPNGATTLETPIPIPDYPGCYCTSSSRWDIEAGKCITNPFGSSNINTGILTNIDGIYCLNNRYWNPVTEKCDSCPPGSGTDHSDPALVSVGGGYTGCYCTSGKRWNENLGICETGICDGHGSVQSGACVCDQNYYLYNGTYCTLCNNGIKEGNSCICPLGKTFSSYQDGCVSSLDAVL